jgi:hypothetical protein
LKRVGIENSFPLVVLKRRFLHSVPGGEDVRPPLSVTDQYEQAHISMSAIGNPFDNAKAEIFFKTLK